MNESAGGASMSTKKNLSNLSFDCRVCSRDLPGEAKVVTLEAPDEDAATQKLLAQGYVVIDVWESGKKKGGVKNIFSALNSSLGKESGGGSFSIFNTVSGRECIFFAVQLATLLKAGIPLLRALEIIQKGISNAFFKTVLQHMRKRVSEGGSFSSALRNYPKVFPWIWVNMTEVGEATGKMPECLEEIAHYQEAAARMSGKVITAFFYPGILLCAVIGALTFLLLLIVPKFSAIFSEHNMQLPALTQAVVTVSDVLRTRFPWVAGIGVVTVIAFVWTSKVRSIKLVYDQIVLKIPIMGDILMQVAVIRFTRSLGTLLRAGVQILQSLEISGRLVGNAFIEAGITRVAEQVRGGQGLGVQLEARKIFPVFMTQLIAVGEESGQLDRFLALLSDYYEEQVDTFLTRLTTLLEPIMLIFMGVVIGTIVIAMFLPIIDLSTGKGMF